MPDLYGIKQTLLSGNTWDKTEPNAGSSIASGIKTYTQDDNGGVFDFSDAQLLGTSTAEISRLEMDLSGIATGDTLDIYIYNGATETLWWSLDPGVYVILAENAGEVLLPSGYEIRCECTSNTTANTTIDIYATLYANVINEVRLLREGNKLRELTIRTGSPTGAPRKVAVGSIDYEVVKYKNETDSDWSSPVDTDTLYYWYDTQGDTNPIKKGPQT